MVIKYFPLGELQANCYFLIDGNDVIIIDPGDSADFILEEISRQNYNVVALIATHGHFDHVMAAGELQAALNVPFYISEKDSFLLKRVGETAKHFLGYTPPIIPVKETTNLSAGKFQISNFKFQILSVPGHTPGSICIYIKNESTLFTGDTLFKDGIGRYDFSYSNKIDLFTSLKKLFDSFPAETLVYPGHGDPTSLGDEERKLGGLSHF